ncbi:hypothetical protein L228DRAFT_240103 [Xylona heveae TC161]|uniref:Brl1/Brr6 domain-containing protein n=1 Tax=Xylona heveae (strain CBS 132557 / TC161) TaxID=1328760 RepID=A0A165FPN9_XYLHT|nr:hypothetical protein L228DRAFT_240103 [Xylona heveae TC161]KZF21233.1 hypothetical protein L228DRAFT_240103 [Xylona heveae TC161]
MSNLRTHESPMDFEWQTLGPADESSPFHRLAVNHRQKSQQGGSAEDDGALGKKRSRSIFDSPSKPSAPSLRDPNSQPFLFSGTPGVKLPPAFRNPAFTTPRKFDVDMFSSGAENASSPEQADAEDTPEPTRTSNTATATAEALWLNGNQNQFSNVFGVPTEKKKETFLDKLRTTTTSLDHGDSRKQYYNNGILKRVQRRRRRDAEREHRLTHRRHDSYESDSDDVRGRRRISSDHRQLRNQDAPSSAKQAVLSSVFAFIENHPNLPHILSFYAQLLLNVFLVFFFIYIICAFWSTIRNDVDKKSEEIAAETLAEMSVCARNYVDNRCDGPNRVPAVETICNNWERCMNRDPNLVGRARVSAHTFAEIFNSFIEPISYKAMFFTLFLVFGCFGISNFAFGFFRNKALASLNAAAPFMHAPQPQYHPPQQQHPGPSAFFNRPYDGYTHFQEAREPGPSGYPLGPGHEPYGLPPAASGRDGKPNVDESPVKRLTYH